MSDEDSPRRNTGPRDKNGKSDRNGVMREVIGKLVEAVETGKSVVYCRLLETRGSTPQKAGATMLIYADGSQVGTLGGGCVEAEVKRRALGVLPTAQSTVATFLLDDDYGWDDGLICGGRMQVLIEPVTAARAAAYFRAALNLLVASGGLTEVIVFDAQKSGLAAPTSYLFDPAGALVARQGENPLGDVPEPVTEMLEPLDERPRAKSQRGIARLVTLPRCRLLIVGGGHIGREVARGAAELDFEVWVVDDREEFVSRERFPTAERLVCGPVARVLRDIEIDADTYAIIVTRGHQHDEEALFHLAQRGAAYVGMIGSKRKIKLIFDDLVEEGVSAEALAQVYAPLGIDIGSQTVPEIAVSILAELVAHRNLQGKVPGRPAPISLTEAL